MKLVSFCIASDAGSATRIGALIREDTVVDLAAALSVLLTTEGHQGIDDAARSAIFSGDMISFLEGGAASFDAAKQAVGFVSSGAAIVPALTDLNGRPVCHPLSDVQLLAPVPKPNSIRDTISFEDHMRNFEKRTGRPIPDYWYECPIYYKGNRCSVVGTNADVYWPSYTNKFDYELEFGIIIGKKGKNIPREEADAYIAGFTIFNDFTARDVIQKEVSVFLGPSKAKDMDTGNAIGPWLVTPDEINPKKLHMAARVNGELWSEGSSSTMYWSFADIIAHISKDETIYPGDFIGSGTVANGCGDELDRWIQPGDIVELEVEGLGVLRNRVVKAADLGG